MPLYKVRPGRVLPQSGTSVDQGTVVELPRHVAEDSIVRDLVQEVDEMGEPVLSKDLIAADLDRFRPHERIALLQARLAEAQAVVSRLAERIAVEQQTVDQDTQAAAAATPIVRELAPNNEE